MERTAEDVKKGLECNARPCGCDMGCPYVDECREDEGCPMSADALALIQQLQAENAEKEQRIRQLERSYSFAADLADGLKAATVKQEQEIYALVERNRQLEAQNAELLEKVEQLQAERDAAVKDLETVCNMMNICRMCKDADEGSERCEGCLMSSNWQWRGVQT